MLAFGISLGFVYYFIGVSSGSDFLVTTIPRRIENKRYLPIYDLHDTTLNVVPYYDILKSLLENGSYVFGDFEENTIGGMFYGKYPVLVVHQPNENIPELHGYYHRWGLDTYDTDRLSSKDDVKHQEFLYFLNSPEDVEGYTPSAALQMYPELKQYKLTKIIEDTDKLRGKLHGCAVLYVRPTKGELKPDAFEEGYSLFEVFYYNSSKMSDPTDILADINDIGEDSYDPLWTVFDHIKTGGEDGYNILNFGEFKEFISKKGYYRFDKFNNTLSSYFQNPTVIVLQPNEEMPELHGYYFDRGIQSLLSYDMPNDGYTPFFDYYLRELDLDGFTPNAARYDYPFFFDYKLTKFITSKVVAEQFAILFLAPSRYRPTNFDENYYVIEDYGLGISSIISYSVV